jgi:hypothetical protein
MRPEYKRTMAPGLVLLLKSPAQLPLVSLKFCTQAAPANSPTEETQAGPSGLGSSPTHHRPETRLHNRGRLPPHLPRPPGR